MTIGKTLLFIIFFAVISSFSFFLSSQSIRLDEAQSIWVASKPLTAVYKLIGEDVHVPFYFTILHFWIQFFGNSILSVRLPSFIFYLSTLVVLYKLSVDSTNKKTGLLTISLFALSPFVMWYSFEARMYTLLTFTSCLSSFFFLRFIRSGGNNSKLGYFLSSLAGVYTHYFFLVLLFCQGIYLLIHISKKITTEINIKTTLINSRKLILAYTLITLTTFMSLIPWFMYVISLGGASNSKPLIPPPTSFNIFQAFAYFVFGFQDVITQGLIVALWPMIIVLLFVIFTKRKQLKVKDLLYFDIISIIPIFVIFVVSFIRPIFLARYLIFTVPSLFFLISNILLVFPKKTANILITITFIIILSFLSYQNLSSNTPAKENYTSATNYLTKNAGFEDIIAISAPFTIYPIEYSYQGQARIDTIPEWNRFTQGGIPPFSLEKFKEQMANYQKKYRNIYIVLSYDQGYESQIRTYLDQFELLEKHQYSVGLEIRKYKLRY